MEKRQDGSTSTSTTLLRRVRDRRDDPAWRAFFDHYDPMLRRWCRGYHLDDESVDELCQRTWHRLWRRMETFQYDPGRRFRGWLRRFLHSRAMDMLNERAAAGGVPFDLSSHEKFRLLVWHPLDDDEPGDDHSSVRLILLSEAAKVQEHVRARVEPANWEAFWLTRIEGRSVVEVARLQGREYAAVYYGSGRAERLVRVEGNRRLAALSGACG